MSKVSTQLKDLKVGDLIYADIVVNTADVADLKSKSTTTTKIKQGKPVRRICLVLVPGQISVQVTYVATFDQSNALPSTLDKKMWYPFKPATKEGDLEPLPELSNGKAQWASIRTKHTITTNPVDKLSDRTVPVASADLIKGKMKA